MINVVSWLWSTGAHREFYDARDVNRLDDALHRHLTLDFTHTCITDRPEGIQSSVQIYPLWDDLRLLGGCYRRLKLFDLEAFKGRVVSIDLDCIILDNIDDLFTREASLTLWRSGTSSALYNGSLFCFDCGVHNSIFRDFDIGRLNQARGNMIGTDQVWLSIVKPEADVWTPEQDGVYAYKHVYKELPENARIVFFPGTIKATWPSTQRKHEWVKNYYADYS